MFKHIRREAARPDAARDARDPRVALLLEAAAAPSEPGPLPGEAEALAAFEASRVTPPRSPVYSTLMTAKMTMAAALSGVLLTGGVGAAAASGSLPGAAQDTASDWLSKVGVTVPGAAERSAEHADERGRGEDAVAGDHGDEAGDHGGEAGDHGSGKAVSEVARDDATSGRDKGAAVSEVASDGRSRAGEHGGSGSEKSEAPEGERHSDGTGHDATTKSSGNADHADRTVGGADDPGEADGAGEDRGDDARSTGDDEADGADGGRPAADSGESP